MVREKEQRPSGTVWVLGGCDDDDGFAIDHLRSRCHRFNPNRGAILLLDLPDSDGTIRNIEHAFDEIALGIARAVGKLRHRVRLRRS